MVLQRVFFLFALISLSISDIYPIPGGDGPIQAKHYIQELVTTTLPCLYNYTVILYTKV